MKPAHLFLSITMVALSAAADISINSTSGGIALRFLPASALYDAVKQQLGAGAASAVVSVDIRANALQLDANHPDATKVRELIAKLDQRQPPSVEQERKQNFGMTGIIMRGPGDLRSIAEVWPDTPAFKAGIRAGDYILAIDSVETKDFTFQELIGSIRGEPGSLVTFTLKHSDTGKIEPITLTLISYDAYRTAKESAGRRIWD